MSYKISPDAKLLNAVETNATGYIAELERGHAQFGQLKYNLDNDGAEGFYRVEELAPHTLATLRAVAAADQSHFVRQAGAQIRQGHRHMTAGLVSGIVSAAFALYAQGQFEHAQSRPIDTFVEIPQVSMAKTQNFKYAKLGLGAAGGTGALLLGVFSLMAARRRYGESADSRVKSYIAQGNLDLIIKEQKSRSDTTFLQDLNP